VFLDLSDELRRVRELREATRRHRELFDYVASGVYQTSPEGELLAVNPALIRLLGFESENELRAMDVANLYEHPEQRAQFTALLERDGFLRNAVLTLRRTDGQVIRIVENGRIVRGEDGRGLYYEGTLNPVASDPAAELDRERHEACDAGGGPSGCTDSVRFLGRRREAWAPTGSRSHWAAASGCFSLAARNCIVTPQVVAS
jgi:PAS domain S-box-containing protein